MVSFVMLNNVTLEFVREMLIRSASFQLKNTYGLLVLSFETLCYHMLCLCYLGNLLFYIEGSNMLSGGEEGVLVRWQWKTHQQQFLPRLGAGINHIAVSPDDSLAAISQKENSKFLKKLYEVVMLFNVIYSKVTTTVKHTCTCILIHTY